MIWGTENTIILWLRGTRAFTSQDERRDEYTELTSLKAEHIPKKKAFQNCGFSPSLWLAWCKDLRGGDGKTNEDCEMRCLGGWSRHTGWSHHREMPQWASAVLLRILLTRNTGACVYITYIWQVRALFTLLACMCSRICFPNEMRAAQGRCCVLFRAPCLTRWGAR